MKKLVLFGDSLFGQLGKHRIVALESELKEYDVYNCAAGGWDTNDCVKKAPYIAQLKPDVVVISLGTNDAAPWKQVALDKFSQNIPKIFEAFAGSKIIYFLPPPVDATKPRDAGKEITNTNIKPYHDAAKEICKQHGVEIIDSFSVFMPMLDSGQEYHIEDGVHLNDFAYETIADELAKVLGKA